MPVAPRLPYLSCHCNPTSLLFCGRSLQLITCFFLKLFSVKSVASEIVLARAHLGPDTGRALWGNACHRKLIMGTPLGEAPPEKQSRCSGPWFHSWEGAAFESDVVRSA